MVCGRICTCDVFSFAKYHHSLKGRSTEEWKREDKELKKLEELIATTMTNPKLIKAEKFKTRLETKRDIQRDESTTFVSTNKNKTATVENWLTTLS